MAIRPVTKEKALDRLTSLCVRSEQCGFDLKRKLINWRLSVADIKGILEYLKEHKYLDETRYAKSFANDKAKFSLWGPYKIKMELSKRKIHPQIIREAVSGVGQEIWKDSLLRCATLKSRNLDMIGEEGYVNRQKLFRYLISRGFPSEAAKKAVAVMKRRQEEE